MTYQSPGLALVYGFLLSSDYWDYSQIWDKRHVHTGRRRIKEPVGVLTRLDCVTPLLQLAALEFPPKILFGNKDERMVAERRNHLEVKHLRSPTRRVSPTVLLVAGADLVLSSVAALPEELVPGDAVVLQLASRGRRRRRLRSHQTRHLRVLAVLQEGRLRVQQPRHRLRFSPEHKLLGAILGGSCERPAEGRRLVSFLSGSRRSEEPSRNFYSELIS